MGGYAEAVRAALPGAVVEPPLGRSGGWVVLTASDPSPREVRSLFPSPRRLAVLSGATERGTEGDVAYARYLAGPPPRLGEDAGAIVRDGGYEGAVLLDGIDATSGRLLLELDRLGVGRVAWREGIDWVVRPTRLALIRKPAAMLERSLARTRVGSWARSRVARARAHLALMHRNRQAFHGEFSWRRHLERVGVAPVARRRDGHLDVMLYIGQLNSGGAERQCVNLAIGLARAGHAVRVLTTYPLTAENAHYCDDLREAGIGFGVAGARPVPEATRALASLDIAPDIIGSLPEVIRNPVLDLAGEMVARPPDVLHCWLDYPNVIGAAAAALVGAPAAVLSTRNLNPRYFPSFYQSWMDEWYAFLVGLPQVHLVANSTQGAADYARWLDVPVSRFEVVYNGVDLAAMTDPDPAEVAAVRDELGLQPGQPLVVAVFRLAPEKQPMLFLDVVERVTRTHPEARFVHAGIGDMAEEVAGAARQRGLEGRLRFLGQRKDVPALLAAADAMVLTSNVEGTPNVVLEAQWAGTPPVATDAGGTPDAMRDGVTGFVHGGGDARGLAGSLVRLLTDDVLRDEMGRAGRAFVRERFSLPHLVEATLEYYESLLGPPPPPEAGAVDGVGAGPARAAGAGSTRAGAEAAAPGSPS